MDIEASGFDKDQLKVHMEDDVLTISGEKKTEKKEEQDGWRSFSSSYSTFSKSTRVPKDVNKEHITASHDGKRLRLSLPKVATLAAPQRHVIPVIDLSKEDQVESKKASEASPSQPKAPPESNKASEASPSQPKALPESNKASEASPSQPKAPPASEQTPLNTPASADKPQSVPVEVVRD